MPSYRSRSTLRQWLVAVDKDVRAELRQVVQNTSAELKTYLTHVTSDWSNKVQFRRVMTVKPALIQASVQAVGQGKKIFGYVDKGTGKYAGGAPYKIKAKHAPMLRFQGGYSPRTTPPAGKGGKPGAGVGTGTSSGAWVAKKEVIHPGIRPRKFAETFDSQLQPAFRRRVINALKRAARRN